MRSIHISVGLLMATYAGLALADPGSLTLASVLPSILGGVASTVVGSLLKGDSGGQQQQQATPAATAAAPPPEVAPPTVMPTPTDTNVKAAQQRSIVAQIQRQGRANSILTQSNNDAMGSA